mmetsp:Transcript_944/g.1185  ORF Transcript_944/g.1185 Transcript_944/m.1185 type:complete len:265 (+) Transcript_944:259-1053(+)
MHRQRNSVYKKVPAEVLEKLPCCFIRSSSRKTTLLRCNKCALFRGKIEHILKKDSDVHAKNSYALKVLIPCTCRSSASTLTAAGKAFLINLLLAKPNLIVRSSIVMPEFCSTFPASKVEWNTVKHFLKNAKQTNKIIAKDISDKPRKTKYSESKPAKQKDELMSKSKRNNKKEQKKDFTVPKRYGSQDEIQKEEMISKSKQKRKRSVHKNNAKTRKSRRLRRELPDDSVIPKEEMVPQSKQKRKKNATIRRSSRIREIKSHKHK